MPYPPQMVKAFKEELTRIGFTDLVTAEAVDSAMKKAETGVTLVAINSVSGCAAAIARPGVRLALENPDHRPDLLLTVFAEQDLEATARMRSYLEDLPPSDPSFALFKDGELVYFMPRYRIESRDANAVAADLDNAFDQFGE
ncbi:BrxA/BrxB family bacilliredoxin [Kitasatospora sp. NPDC098652]|uniref:BrxA/BrxB family bacilliredoxin n=1 Tax=Kitasatospora sp. NPDC098652 TaxID=3364095 RepID=UPI00380D3382